MTFFSNLHTTHFLKIVSFSYFLRFIFSMFYHLERLLFLACAILGCLVNVRYINVQYDRFNFRILRRKIVLTVRRVVFVWILWKYEARVTEMKKENRWKVNVFQYWYSALVAVNIKIVVSRINIWKFWHLFLRIKEFVVKNNKIKY